MGIQGLTKLIADNVPDAIKEEDIKNYFGRTIAIDASMSLYQFLIAVRPDDLGQFTLTNDHGETTSHLQGMFYRTIKMLSNGLKPVFVFDGKAPQMKGGELAKRKKKKEEAEEGKEKATEEGDKEMIRKMNKRIIKVTPEITAETKKLLGLMGVPVVQAPCEAEAQCAALCKAGKVWASGSEDMDTLTCGTPILVRHLTYSDARKEPIMEIHLDRVLSGLGLSMEQFIDLCILLGCDYADKIRGIGPKRALEFIKKYGSLEKILKFLDKDKYKVPEVYPYEDIRTYFKNPDACPVEDCKITFNDPDEEGLVQFLCTEKGFNEERVRSGIQKLKQAKEKAVQSRITSYFQVKPSEVKTTPRKTPTKAASKPTAKGRAASAAASKKRPLEKASPKKNVKKQKTS